MKTRIFIILTALMSALSMQSAGLSAQEVMRRCAATVSVSSGVTVGFRITGNQNITGTLITQGSKFYLAAGESKVWYNGKVMTTLNQHTNEATVTNPSAAEVNEAFPLSYVANWSNDYTVVFASTQPKDGYCLVLSPRRAAAVAKKAVLTVSKSNFRPQKLVISLKRGGTSTVEVQRFTIGGTSSASNFQYPASKYPKVKVVDLR